MAGQSRATYAGVSVGGRSVWTGRASQAENDELRKLVLHFCIWLIDGAFGTPGHHGYPRAFDLIRD